MAKLGKVTIARRRIKLSSKDGMDIEKAYGKYGADHCLKLLKTNRFKKYTKVLMLLTLTRLEIVKEERAAK